MDYGHIDAMHSKTMYLLHVYRHNVDTSHIQRQCFWTACLQTQCWHITYSKTVFLGSMFTDTMLTHHIFKDSVSGFHVYRHNGDTSRIQSEVESLKELLNTYEQSLERKDQVITNLTDSLQRHRDKFDVQRAFCEWKIKHNDRKREVCFSCINFFSSFFVNFCFSFFINFYSPLFENLIL